MKECYNKRKTTTQSWKLNIGYKNLNRWAKRMNATEVQIIMS